MACEFLMPISFIFSYLESFFVAFYLSFYFVLAKDTSARHKTMVLLDGAKE